MLPKSTTESPRPYDMSIHTNPDAAAWARFFVETWPRVYPGQPVPDEGWMLGWFANAMMAMHDHLAASPRPPSSPDPACEDPRIQRIREWGDRYLDGKGYPHTLFWEILAPAPSPDPGERPCGVQNAGNPPATCDLSAGHAGDHRWWGPPPNWKSPAPSPAAVPDPGDGEARCRCGLVAFAQPGAPPWAGHSVDGCVRGAPQGPKPDAGG